MIIGISGSVGSGKTSLAKELSKNLNYKLINLNELANDFKIEDISDLQTFDFDLDKLLEKIEEDIKNYIKNNENIILEGHFVHEISSELINKLVIISRPLNLLKEEYIRRNYNENKIKDNLEVESFNLCFYEAIENGYGEESSTLADFKNDKERIFGDLKLFDNDSNFENLIKEVQEYILNN